MAEGKAPGRTSENRGKTDRRVKADPNYAGPERRQADRRKDPRS